MLSAPTPAEGFGFMRADGIAGDVFFARHNGPMASYVGVRFRGDSGGDGEMVRGQYSNWVVLERVEVDYG